MTQRIVESGGNSLDASLSEVGWEPGAAEGKRNTLRLLRITLLPRSLVSPPLLFTSMRIVP